jgi:probable phosphoglycerate mutase
MTQRSSASVFGPVRLPSTYVARHGETTWTLSRQHTGLANLPLTERGEPNARLLGERPKAPPFTPAFTSPLRRAFRTCQPRRLCRGG